MTSKTLIPYLVSAALLSPLIADEILDEIDAAREAYEAAEYSTAVGALEQATALMNEKKSTAISKALPDTIGDWKAGELTSEGSGVTMFGGGNMVSRKYTKGDTVVNIQLMADSPMISQVMGMMNSPAMANAMGMKSKRIGSEKGLYDPKANSLSMIIQNRFLIQIEKSKATEEEVLELANGIETKVLTELK